ncbi:substrate-binding periplasmic protein [Thalassotalea euphylliae]|uniref:substrate-binding periplasmic protein n=1 Tax=Thalassotalea euphylliae TaxID=1655234 RepID=UPI00362ACA0C
MFTKILISLLVLLPYALTASELVLKYDPSGSSTWIPYYIAESEQPGIMGELIPLVLARSKIKGKKIVLPAARMNKALEGGVIDFDIISPSWIKPNERIGQFVFSEDIMSIEEYTVKLASSTQHIPYKGNRVGTVRGYLYHDDDQYKRVDFSSEKNLVMALSTKRIKVAIIGKLPAQYWASQLGVEIKFQELHSSGMLHIRLRSEFSHLLPQINAAITSVKADGTIDNLVKKYTDGHIYH